MGDLDTLFEFVDNKNTQLTIPLYTGWCYHIDEIPVEPTNLCTNIKNDEKLCGKCVACLQNQLLQIICDGKYRENSKNHINFMITLVCLLMQIFINC